MKMIRMVRRGFLAVFGLVLPGRSRICNEPFQQPLDANAIGLVADSASPSIQSDDPNDFVQVRDGKFSLGDRPFVIKGTNYFGSWRYHYTIKQRDSVERGNIWTFYREWNIQKLELDFQFIYSRLHATAVRIGTPAEADLASLVQYQNYRSWTNPDGTIAEQYRYELTKLIDAAYANGIRVQLCLLWNVGAEIVDDPDAFNAGGRMDRLYSNQVRSIALALQDHPGVLGYSIGNEVLVKWPINGTHTSLYEARAGGFILRRLADLRTIAPRQLLTLDEVATPGAMNWHDPGPEFALLPDLDGSNGGKPFRLADKVDYLAPHFYPATLAAEDSSERFNRKIHEAKKELRLYVQAASAVRKPVAIGEFGLVTAPMTLPPERYAVARDRLFEEFLSEGEKIGLQGLLAWGALPAVKLKQGHYSVRASEVTPSSPTEVDVDDGNSGPRRILFYDPLFALFIWRENDEVPIATRAAEAIASAWPQIPRPRLPTSTLPR